MTTQQDEDRIAQALAVCAELTGTVLTPMAFDAMLEDLAAYPVDMVLNALNRCRRELTGRLTLAAVLQRIDCGLPSADEAFGLLAEGARNEYLTVVVPEIALLAMGQGAQALLDLGDKTGARMAFRGAYERMAEELRSRGEMCRWAVSAGLDKQHLAAAVAEAVRLGRLPKADALMALPFEAADVRYEMQTGALPSPEDKQRAADLVGGMLALLAEKMATPSPIEREQRAKQVKFEANRQAVLAALQGARDGQAA